MDFNKAANYIFLNAVSNRHDNTSFDRKNIDKNIRYLEKRIHDIKAMYEILKKVDLSNKNYSKLLKIVPESMYTLDPVYLYTSGYKNKKGKFKFPKKIHIKIAKFARSLDDRSIFILTCRYTATNHSLRYTDEDLVGFYRYHYGYIAKAKGKQFYEKIIIINGIKEVIISNYPFKGFSKI